jgi:hypothetical protein
MRETVDPIRGSLKQFLVGKRPENETTTDVESVVVQ